MLDLSPARWIWFPSQRTLANTFVLFRRELVLEALPRRAAGWITADSRYRMTVNGERVQWGPAPCDPRQYDVDEVELTPFLHAGRNVIGVEALFYGHGDGTWPAGKPGMICRFEIEHADGRQELVVSDASWHAYLDRAHRPGQYKRWFLRALQEEFDARVHPVGWNMPSYQENARWLPAMLLHNRSDKPAICSSYWEYTGTDAAPPETCSLRPREIPPLREIEISALRLSDSGSVRWLRDPLDWFEFRTPGAFEITRHAPKTLAADGPWTLHHEADDATFLTFEFGEQLVGWPFVEVEAPEGTIIELITQESHDPNGPAWLDTHMFTWARFTCREGANRFETFDYESLRWIQLHIRNANGMVKVRAVGVRRRLFPWPNEARIEVDDPTLQRVFDATLNTLANSAQETCVDGMGRERQQYSGDGGHQLVPIRYVFGETRLPRRFLRTFSEGITVDGYFLDCWPAYDRLQRVSQRQIGAAWWGPLLDHGVGFVFDCWQHYWETGDLDALREPFPRLLRFANYLIGLRGEHDMLPVENLGVPAVWIDHEAYRMQRHKQCAFNLYAAAMLTNALAPICRAFGEHAIADGWQQIGESLLAATVARFWDAERGMFVNNLPWLAEEGELRLCDRSLATAVLFGQCPDNNTQAALLALAERPPNLGISYPANALWRYRALCQGGFSRVVLDEFRTHWASMRSVVENNTLQEFWQARPDTPDQWSHCPIAPLSILFTDIAGIVPTEPGFASVSVQPRLAGIGSFGVTAHTVRGPIQFRAEAAEGGHHVAVALPAGMQGDMLLQDGSRHPIDSRERVIFYRNQEA